MKIAIIGPAPPYRGGISLFALNLAKALRNQGHELLLLNFTRQYPSLLFPGKDQFDNSLVDMSFRNLRMITPWNPCSWHQTTKLINQEQVERVIVSWFLPFFAPAYGWILRRIPLSRKIILAHNVRPHEPWPLAKALQNYAFKPADKIVVLSHATYQELLKDSSAAMKSKAVAGFHPIAEFIEPRPDQSERKELLFFGLIKAYKGLDVLLKAMPLILKELPDTILHIAGEVYGDERRYRQLIAALGIKASVIADFSYVKAEEIPRLFNKAALTILPYKSASQSGVIATSYQYGVPVLASAVGGLGEYVIAGKTGYLVRPNDPVELANTVIKHLINKPDMTTNIRTYIDNYSWEALAELFTSI